ncbi:MAG: hypothetical protein J6T16_03050 [Opitutales bacterium]|nr:hypothetical protein [Opitutales bacterium]
MGEDQPELFDPLELSECELLPQEALEKLKSDEDAVAKYTAGRLAEKHPKLYQAARAMLAKGVSVNETAHLLSLHPYTVEALRELEKNYIEGAKKRLAKNAFAAAEIAVEKIKETLIQINPSKIDDLYRLSLMSGTLIEKGSLLTGGATQRIETQDTKTFKDKSEYEKSMFGEIVEGEIAGEEEAQ